MFQSQKALLSSMMVNLTRPCFVLTSFLAATDFATEIFFPEEETKDFGRFSIGRDRLCRSP